MTGKLFISLRDFIRDASDFIALLLLDRRETRARLLDPSAPHRIVRLEAEAPDAFH